ncbi:hypothetical protein S40293_09047 [Stachybotrys chartarum IBT 40293]|nr:hypothetical protein S40293_09047 [Stachybotrys chartarum IBT 40293]
MVANAGITGDQPIQGPTVVLLVVLDSIAIYNVVELTFIILAIFKRRTGVYFWSFVVATYGILLYSGGFMMRTVAPPQGSYAYITLIAVGWVAMVTGQSMVLWSRLHLILWNSARIKLILRMIIFNAICMHIPIIVMVFGANSSKPGIWAQPYSVFEKLQITVFFVQESIISSLYIFEARKFSQLQSAVNNRNRPSRAMNDLVALNILIILLDMTILALEYANLYAVQTSFKALAYSIKLKMEYHILNQLVEAVSGHRRCSLDNGWTIPRNGQRDATSNTGASSSVPMTSLIMRPENILYQTHITSTSDSYHDTWPLGNDCQMPGDVGVLKTTEVKVTSEPRSAGEPQSRL